MTSTSTEHGGASNPAPEDAAPTAKATQPLEAAEAVAWGTLDALGTQGRAAADIEAAGGPLALLAGDPLALWAVREQSRLRRGRETPLPLDERSARAEVFSRILVAQKKAERLWPFLDRGGVVLAGLQVGRLSRAKSPPLCLFARGSVELVAEIGPRMAVSLVGTRTPTERGEERAHVWGKAFASRGIIVVSGGARGIDLAAHAGALAAGGETLAVLGDGVRVSAGGRVTDRPGRLDFVFKQAPPSARSLSLTASGPWVGVSRASFVSRNRLVAALSDAVVLIEGGAGSGALHTIKNAREIGVPTFAVPGDPSSLQSVASNEVLANGTAAVATAPEKILQAIGGMSPICVSADGIAASSTQPSDPLLRALWDAGGTLSIDALATLLACPVAAVLRDGLRWELEGELVREGGCYALARLR